MLAQLECEMPYFYDNVVLTGFFFSLSSSFPCSFFFGAGIRRLFGMSCEFRGKLCWTANTELRWKAIYINCKLGINSFELSETFGSVAPCAWRWWWWCWWWYSQKCNKEVKCERMFAVRNTMTCSCVQKRPDSEKWSIEQAIGFEVLFRTYMRGPA